jgi:hypothetical protein
LRCKAAAGNPVLHAGNHLPLFTDGSPRSYEMKMSLCPLLAFAAVLKFSTCLGADLAAPPQSPSDPDLPQPVNGAAVQEILANSPFTRSLDLSHTLQLTGIAYVEGHPVATFFNRETKGSFVLSDEPDQAGWRLLEALPSTELTRTVVKIQAMNELVTISFGDEQIDPGASKKGAIMARAEKTHSSGKHSLAEGGKTSGKSAEELMEVYARKHPDASQEQLDAMVQKALAKAQNAEQRDLNGGTKAPKPGKGSKNR